MWEKIDTRENFYELGKICMINILFIATKNTFYNNWVWTLLSFLFAKNYLKLSESHVAEKKEVRGLEKCVQKLAKSGSSLLFNGARYLKLSVFLTKAYPGCHIENIILPFCAVTLENIKKQVLMGLHKITTFHLNLYAYRITFQGGFTVSDSSDGQSKNPDFFI